MDGERDDRAQQPGMRRRTRERERGGDGGKKQGGDREDRGSHMLNLAEVHAKGITSEWELAKKWWLNPVRERERERQRERDRERETERERQRERQRERERESQSMTAGTFIYPLCRSPDSFLCVFFCHKLATDETKYLKSRCNKTVFHHTSACFCAGLCCHCFCCHKIIVTYSTITQKSQILSSQTNCLNRSLKKLL